MKRILDLAAALSGARTSDEVAEIMVRQGVDALQAATGVFAQPRADGALEIINHHVSGPLKTIEFIAKVARAGGAS